MFKYYDKVHYENNSEKMALCKSANIMDFTVPIWHKPNPTGNTFLSKYPQ